MPEALDRLESLFAAAVALETPAERVALLDRECGGDQALRGRVEALLRANERAGNLLDRPVPGGPEQTGPYLPGEQPGTIIAAREARMRCPEITKCHSLDYTQPTGAWYSQD